MKVLNRQARSVENPPVLVAVKFDPWPFDETSVQTTDEMCYIDGTPELVTEDGPWQLLKVDDNILVTLADGRQAVTCEDALAVYTERYGWA